MLYHEILCKNECRDKHNIYIAEIQCFLKLCIGAVYFIN